MAGVNQLKSWSPWILGAGAILAVFAVTWFASILQSVRHEPGVDGQYRVFLFFSPGSALWGVAVLLGVALVAAGRHFDQDRADTPHQALVTFGLMGAAAVVGISAAVDILVELTNFGNGIDDALSGIVSYIGVFPLSAAALWWAIQLRARKSSS